MRQYNLLRAHRPLLLLCLAPALVVAQQPADRVDVRITGTVLLNTFYTSARTNNFDNPQFAQRPAQVDSLGDGGGFGMTVRQTRLGVRAFWPEVAGAELRAEVDADFYGGQQQSGFGDGFPLFHIRRAIVDVQWDRATLLVGQEVPLVAEYNPLSFASVGLSGFATSGNLWLWLPQIRGGLRVVRTRAVRLDLDAAVIGAGSNEAAGELLTQPDRAEQSDRPSVEARAALRWGSPERPGDVSLGVHHGWFATSGDSLLCAHAVAAAARIPLGSRLELTGEAFSGRALAGLGGGGIAQLLGPNNLPVRTRGGWGQAVVRLPNSVALAAGLGIDDPDDADLDAAGRLRNVTTLGALHWTPTPFVAAVEVRRLTTSYRTGDRTATHLNLALGVAF